MEEILQFLLKSNADEAALKNFVLPQLERLGFNSLADLVDMEHKDLDIKGLTELNRRRIWKLVKGLEKSEQTENETSDIDLENIYVRYIPCTTGLFSEDIKDHIIDQIPAKMKSMDYLVSLIEKDLNIPDDQVIELYTCEGYPMQLNDITAKATLEIWGVSDGELFYVMSHKKDQPGQKRFATLPGIDHDIGQESFTVEMPCQNNLKVNAYIGVDSPEDIGQKIYSLTGVSVPYMSLFIRRGYSYERLSAYSELEDKDVIRVVLRNPNELVNPRSVNFGSRSYNPLISHSKLGLSKFCSILKFLRSPRPSNADYDFEKLLSCILHVTNFPPLVYAMRMLREQSFLTIAGWTALVEGLFALFKTVINTFATVSDETVFEYSDYLWGVLIRQSQKITDISNVTCDQLSLLCAISGTRILKPVLIPNLGYCDESHVLAHASIDLKKVQYNSENEVSRLLLCFPWESDKEVYKWINAPKPAIPEILKKIDPSTQLELKEKFALKELSESLEQLSIINPKGLFGGTQCLTFVDEGRLVYFMGFAKGTDEERRIYDPISCHEEYLVFWKKSTLDEIGSSEMQIKKVSNDLITVWKNVIKQEEQKEIPSIRTNAIIKPQDSIKWEPEEAIVVLLDRSGSMSSYIFDIDKLTRIDAAKELFNAFVTRTQAYQLHHCFGLTIFDHRIEVKLEITKNPEKFETSLKGIGPDGGTALTDAIINGANQLKDYQCKKRILCLTDGFNGSRTPYSDVLQVVMSHNVIVDTVLLTGPGGNIEQKALSHASGGVCVLPLNMKDALMFFEMDAMLSLHERPNTHVGQNASLTHFKDLKAYPYETKDHLKCHIANTEKTVALDSYMNKLANTPSTSNQKRRIITELKVFKQHPHADIAVFPSQQNYNKWKVVIRGPKKTAYEKGTFVLSVSFPDKYPGEPPQIRFLTPIYHCNISGTSGRICHAALSTSYTPAMRMREILCHIYGLLMCPDVDTPIDGTLADQYGYFRYHNESKELPKKFFSEADMYFDEAKKWVMTNAFKSFEELCKEFEGTP